jgi:hypothetical protein
MCAGRLLEPVHLFECGTVPAWSSSCGLVLLWVPQWVWPDPRRMQPTCEHVFQAVEPVIA